MDTLRKNSIHLFIIWHNAATYEDAIMQDIKNRFDVFRIYYIKWSESYFAKGLARFYGKKLPKNIKKQKEVGLGDFKVVLVYDNAPDMVNGKNRNVTSAKLKHRQKCGANVIHASDNAAETDEELLFLFGKTSQEIIKEPSNDDVILYHHDVIGFPCWESLEEALETVKKIPSTEIREQKDAIWILGPQPFLIKRVLNARKSWCPCGHKHFIDIQDKKYPLYIKKQ